MSTNQKQKKGGSKKHGKEGGGGGDYKKGGNNSQKNFKSLWEMDDQEKLQQEEQMQMLNQKYRDRAKERRQGQYDLRQDGQGFAIISDSDDEENGGKMIQVKGLDFDLLREQQRKIEEEEKTKKSNKEQLEKIKQQVLQTKLKKEQEKQKQISKLSKEQQQIIQGINKVIKEKDNMNVGLFPKPFTYYRYDLTGINFNSDLPLVIQKQRHQDQVQTMIAQVSDNCYEQMGRVMRILKTGGRKQLREEREKSQNLSKQMQQNQEQDDDSDSDIFGDSSPKEKKEKKINKSNNNNNEVKPLKLLKDNEKIFDEEILPEEAEKLRKQQQQEKDSGKMEQVKQQIKDNFKRKVNPFDEDDYYGECFQSSAPSLNQLKKMKAEGAFESVKDGKKKVKKENYDQQYKKIEKILQEKQGN